MPTLPALDRLKADLDILRPLAPEQEQRVLQKFRLEWNYNSNAIEGNSLTLGETRSLLLHGLTAAGKPLRDHIDIEGHNEAVLWLEDFVRDARPLTEQFIRGMHEVLLKEPYEVKAQTTDGQPTRKRIVPGQYKTAPNNVLTATGEMFYFASPEETPARMTDLVDWYRQEEASPTMHPVALAAEFHYRFVRIHPFDDGNGRMSRLLMNLILLRHGYPMTVIKAVDRNRYLAALSEADAGDPEPFLRFIVENVEAGLRLMIRAAKGESIDEPDELDKKLALLKKQVLSRENSISIIWNEETQTHLYNKLLEFWVTDFINQMHRFDDLFLNSESSLWFRESSDEEFTVYRDDQHSTLLEKFHQKIIHDDILVSEFAMQAAWNEFRTLDNTFNVAIGLMLNFSKYKFEASVSVFERYDAAEVSTATDVIPKSIFSSLYKMDYDQSLIHEINYQLANKVYDFIAAKVAEADSSPS